MSKSGQTQDLSDDFQPETDSSETTRDLGSDLKAVQEAAERLKGHLVRTPTLRNTQLDRYVGAELWFKAENLQHIGAFKARGAFNFLARMNPEIRARGVVTYSSGNHGQAVAWAAHQFGVSAHVAMPINAPNIKRSAVESMGGIVLDGGHDFEQRKRVAEDFANKYDRIIVPPFDHLDIIAGQGTAILELIEDLGQATGHISGQINGDAPLDALFVPVGGGGAIAGACLACNSTNIPIYAVEPIGCDAMAQSLRASKRVQVQSIETLADGLKPSCVGQLNFAIAQQALAGSICVDDHQIGQALVALLIMGKILVEASAATALAGAISHLKQRNHHFARSSPRIGVLLTGGNIDPEQLGQLLVRHSKEITKNL